MSKTILTFLTVFWICAVSLAIASMHSWHSAGMVVEKDAVAGLSELFSDPQEMNIAHFVIPSCGCSNVIMERLIDRGPLRHRDWKEKVVLIDDFDFRYTKQLKAKGHDVLNLSLSDFRERFGESLSAVPLLVSFDRDKKLVYAGGYSQKSITPFSKIDVVKIIESAKEENQSGLPVVGCAVSEKYQKILDPMGIKYAKVE